MTRDLERLDLNALGRNNEAANLVLVTRPPTRCLDVDRSPFAMLVNTALPTKYKIEDEALECVPLAFEARHHLYTTETAILDFLGA